MTPLVLYDSITRGKMSKFNTRALSAGSGCMKPSSVIPSPYVIPPSVTPSLRDSLLRDPPLRDSFRSPFAVVCILTLGCCFCCIRRFFRKRRGKDAKKGKAAVDIKSVQLLGNAYNKDKVPLFGLLRGALHFARAQESNKDVEEIFCVYEIITKKM